jgi:pyruvate, orthophosphate dikinase
MNTTILEQQLTTIYHFGLGPTNAFGLTADILGGKGFGLVEMASIEGVPVPPGGIIPTTMCQPYLQSKELTPELKQKVVETVAEIGEKTGRVFGDATNPLVLSCRSGAAVSMPGMLKTILNIGISRATIPGYAAMFNESTAWDNYRRLIDMWSETVMGIDRNHFEHAFEEYKQQHNIATDNDMTTADWQKLCDIYETIFEDKAEMQFPQDVWEQLFPAIEAVFKSWYGQKAIDYRQIEKLDDLLGTAVVFMAMKYGNLNDRSGTGVLFTRNPSTGEDELYGEVLFKAQGEDVVAGIRTPEPISRLKEVMPDVYAELFRIVKLLETNRKDIQDIEFTIEDGNLFMLQTRNGKRNGPAAFKIAHDMVQEGLVTKEHAVAKLVKPDHVLQMVLPCVSDEVVEMARTNNRIFVKGLAASPGAAVGHIVFDQEAALAMAKDPKNPKPVILVRKETSPEDIKGMHASRAVLTSTGGLSSHAAVVLRGWGKPCVVGADACSIDYHAKTVTVGDVVLQEGDVITVNGTTGEVIVGACPLTTPEWTSEFTAVLQWADEMRTLGIRANCESPKDAQEARQYGAEGIGLFRVEHMFYGEEADHELYLMKKMILTNSPQEKGIALAALKPAYKKSFYGTFIAMDPLPITVRLKDPPLGEFAVFSIPITDAQIKSQDVMKKKLCSDLGISAEELDRRIEDLHEVNPGSGFRGSRIGVVYPEITATQVEALCETIITLRQEGYNPHIEIEVPFVMNKEEFEDQYNVIVAVAEKYNLQPGIDFLVGSMLENMGACFDAGNLASITGFQTFGTNDLSSSILNISRDDASKFLSIYVEKKILAVDPFQTLHPLVAKGMKIAIEGARAVNPNLEIGICGEQGGDPKSIAMCQELGLSYVSCSPFRVPVARLAAAQSAIAASKAQNAN